MNNENSEQEYLRLIGENIRKYRYRKSWSQEKLGLEIGMTRGQISQMEKGQNITVITVLKLSIAMDVKPESIIKVKFVGAKNVLEGLVESSKAYKRSRS